MPEEPFFFRVGMDAFARYFGGCAYQTVAAIERAFDDELILRGDVEHLAKGGHFAVDRCRGALPTVLCPRVESLIAEGA